MTEYQVNSLPRPDPNISQHAVGQSLVVTLSPPELDQLQGMSTMEKG